MENTLPKLLHTGAMARRLGVAATWLRAEAEAGRLPAVPAGRHHLFDPETVERVLIERARRAAEGGDRHAR